MSLNVEQTGRGVRWDASDARQLRRVVMISHVTSSAVSAQHLRDLARLRRVRDRIDREYAQPLDVEALARGAAGCSSLGTFSSRFTELVGVPPAPTGARRRA